MNTAFKTSLKKGDQVVVISGKDKGKRGRILKIVTDQESALVERINMIKRHTRATKDKEASIVEKEAPIHISNLMFYDVATGKGSRIGKKILEDGRKVRVAIKSGETIDR
ncbi:50S ribosomal protein L24 [Candidatus Magnetaquicoccaceae bacterium FCR-1]|uniref:Large ribosomal subunit protein uL24 n=1 Tax=Candidatus Magnetaquiglobus chichijimensis TaxID=3141448 RepID=A0ABQ0CAT6_9PROT